MITAIFNESDSAYFGESYNSEAEAESRIEELELDFGKGTFFTKHVCISLLSSTCEVCNEQGNNQAFAFDDGTGVFRCPKCQRLKDTEIHLRKRQPNR